MRILIRLAACAILLAPAAIAVAADKGSTIPADLMKPGASFYFDLPELGDSLRREALKQPGPVQMFVNLPDNYAKDHPHPVIILLGGATGFIAQAESWMRVVKKENFIAIGVDYSAKNRREENNGSDPGFVNAVAALEVLGRSSAYDKQMVILSGSSGGAMCVAENMGCENAKRFCAFVLINGFVQNGSALGDHALLLIAGEKDDHVAYKDGRTVAQVARTNDSTLRHAGANVQLVWQLGIGHDWQEPWFEPCREWLYTRVPGSAEAKRMWQIDHLRDETKLERRRTWYDQQLAASWWEMDNSAAARATVKP